MSTFDNLSYVILDKKHFSFGVYVGPNKQYEDIPLGSVKLHDTNFLTFDLKKKEYILKRSKPRYEKNCKLQPH